MVFAVWIPLLLQLLAPLAMLVWLAYGRPRSRLVWLLTVMVVAFYLLIAAVAGLWLIVPWYTPGAYVVLLLVAVGLSIRRTRERPVWPRSTRGWVAAGILVSLAAGITAIAIYALSGWRPPPAPVELSFPLGSGTYLVVNGGGNTLINAHVSTLQGDRFRRWRGQSYGVDLVMLNRYGFRSRGILPSNPEAYVIFGVPVHAPCQGEVVIAVDGAPEMKPPHMDRQNMAGNHVILKCGGRWIVLAHLQKGSVVVGEGRRVSAGQPLGRVGNSGNSSEPHLHIHAQSPGTIDSPLSGDPLPIRLGGRYPVRNARFMAQTGRKR